MKMRIVFFICFVLSSVILTAAQARVVTNADLDKYSAARLKAEKDLRENYSRLGFSSPEERARRDAAAAKERSELSAKLRQERIAQERAAAEVEQLRVQQARYDAYIRSLSYERQRPNTYPDYSVFGYGYGRGYRGWPPQQPYGTAWRADASGVVYEPGSRPSSIWTPVFVPPPTPIRRRP